MDVLSLVQEFATEAHGTQRRKFVDEPYIVHPIRVMERCRVVTSKRALLAAALLHDVLEDTPVTQDELEQFLQRITGLHEASEILRLVVELTDMYTHQAYPKLNRRERKTREVTRMAATSVDAQTIKYADIMDNLEDITEAQNDFTRVYLYESRTLLKNIPNGHPDLYKKAMHVVNENLALY